MNFYEPSEENCPTVPFTTYIYGLWLMGAEWDPETQLLMEQDTPNVYDQFPVVKVSTELKPENVGMEPEGHSDEEFPDNPQLSKKEVKEQIESEKL